MLCPGSLFGQEAQEKRQSHGPSPSLLHDADIPVHETEVETAEAKQAEAKEEALKSLFVHKRYTILPIPAVHYDRNERYWAGMVMPVLQTNPKDELQNIYAPFYMHNQYVGETVGLNYY